MCEENAGLLEQNADNTIIIIIIIIMWRRWEDNIKMDLQEVGGGCEDWMELAQDRDSWRAFGSSVMNLRVPKMRGISWLAAEPDSLSRRTLLHGVEEYAFWFIKPFEL